MMRARLGIASPNSGAPAPAGTQTKRYYVAVLAAILALLPAMAFAQTVGQSAGNPALTSTLQIVAGLAWAVVPVVAFLRTTKTPRGIVQGFAIGLAAIVGIVALVITGGIDFKGIHDETTLLAAVGLAIAETKLVYAVLFKGTTAGQTVLNWLEAIGSNPLPPTTPTGAV